MIIGLASANDTGLGKTVEDFFRSQCFATYTASDVALEELGHGNNIVTGITDLAEIVALEGFQRQAYLMVVLPAGEKGGDLCKYSDIGLQTTGDQEILHRKLMFVYKLLSNGEQNTQILPETKWIGTGDTRFALVPNATRLGYRIVDADLVPLGC